MGGSAIDVVDDGWAVSCGIDGELMLRFGDDQSYNPCGEKALDAEVEVIVEV